MTKTIRSLTQQAALLFGLIIATGAAHAQNWTTQSNMKVARVEATTIDYRGDIYVFNGFKPGIKIANSVEKYDVATEKWSIIGSTTTLNDTAVTHNGAVRVGADVWILGGRVGSHPGRVTDKVWIYNLVNRKWRQGPKLPVPSAAGGAALVNNKVHWIGGLDANASCDVDHHYVYDLGKPAAGWKDITSTAAIPSPRNHFSTAVVNGIIYVMGGQYGHDGCPGKGTEDTTLVHAFNPANNKWSRKADMPSKNSHTEPGTFVYKGNIYTTGGENAGDKVWKYNPKVNKWSTFRTLPEKLVAPIARIIDGRLIVAGGGAPRAALATDTVRSLQVDNTPSTPQPEPQPEPTPTPTPQPEPEPQPEPQPVPGSQTPEMATLISMEAEYFDVINNTPTHQWVHVARGDSSNDAALITTPDQGELAGDTRNTPMLSYMVYFNSPGKHYLWVRGLGDSNNNGVGSSDSIHVGLNGTVATSAYRIDQFPDQWTWSRHTPTNPVASLNVVNAGVNIVNFWMREDGLAIDKFVITSDPQIIPTGHGPVLSDGTDDYVAPALDDNGDEDSTDIESIETNNANEVVDTNTTIDITVSDNTNDLQTDTDTSIVESVVIEDAVKQSIVTISADDDNGVIASENDVIKDALALDDATNANTISKSTGVFGGSLSSTTLLLFLVFLFFRFAYPAKRNTCT